MGVRIPLPLPEAPDLLYKRRKQSISQKFWLDFSMEMSKAQLVGRSRRRSYIEEVKAEMRRVTWPTWKQVRATTGVVIAAVFLFAGVLRVVDAVVNAAY